MDSLVKRICCSCRGLRFASSTHMAATNHLLASVVPGTHMVHKQKTHTHKIILKCKLGIVVHVCESRGLAQV